jgi:hypothetical protein
MANNTNPTPPNAAPATPMAGTSPSTPAGSTMVPPAIQPSGAAPTSLPAAMPTGTDPALVGGQLTTEVQEVDGFQHVPRVPGNPREADDFDPAGTVKNDQIAEYQRQEREALLGKAPAPPWAPASERRLSEEAFANKGEGDRPAAPTDRTVKPDTTSIVSSLMETGPGEGVPAGTEVPAAKTEPSADNK